MRDPAVRLQIHILAGQVEAGAFAIRPLITDIAARLCFSDANGHAEFVKAFAEVLRFAIFERSETLRFMVSSCRLLVSLIRQRRHCELS